MAFTVTKTLTSPNWESWTVEASAAADGVVVIPHTLGRVPLLIIITPLNDAAALAVEHVENVTDTQFEFHKQAGVGAGMISHVHLSTLRHPH